MSSPLLDLFGVPPIIDPMDLDPPEGVEDPPAEAYKRDKPIHVLALGGGRITGLSSLRVLEELMKKVAVLRGLPANTDVRPCECFELIVGTGTGGLSALFLGRMRMTVRKAIEEYIRVVRMSFETPWMTVTRTLEWPPVLLDDDMFKLIFGSITERFLRDINAGLRSDPTRCHTAIIVSNSADQDASLEMCTSYASSPDELISNVARATLSHTSPTFNLSELPAIDEADMLAEVALIAAGTLSPGSGAGCLVSLGAGPHRLSRSPATDFLPAASDRDASFEGIQSCDATACDCVHGQFLRDHSGHDVSYFRFNVDHGPRKGYALDSSNLGINIADMISYVQRQAVNIGIESCASLLCIEEPFSKRSPLCLDGKISNKSEYSAAAGGYADIYTGTFRNQKVAIKIMRPFSATGSPIENATLLKRLWREYITWSKLSHPNILDCLGFSYNFTPQTGHKIPSLISHWMANGTVLSYIKENPNLDRLEIAVGIARGLTYLHNRRPEIVHGDLRAGNVLVSDTGVPCLTDFGLSRIISETHCATTSSTGGVAGSLRWMAPELFGDKGKLSLQSDVWAFGMTVLEIFTGRRPFDELYLDPQALLRILAGQLPARPVRADISLTDEVWMLCQKCWRQHPAQRPRMADVLVQITSVNV